MTNLREAAQMALTLVDVLETDKVINEQEASTLRAALAQLEPEPTVKQSLQVQEPVATLFGSLPVYDVPPKQKPVAWMHNFIAENVVAHRPADLDRHPDRWTALYKDPTPCQTCESLARTVMMDQTSHDTPPQRPWQGLPDNEIRRIELTVHGYTRQPLDVKAFARAIEAKLKEKNT